VKTSMGIANALRGEFTAMLAGKPFLFDTTLGTVARIEESCGDRAVVEIVNRVVIGRRAVDQAGLIAAALVTRGCPEGDAAALAARVTVPEAEAFILALMGALGFALQPRTGEGQPGEPSPLHGPNAGGAGALLRSEP
jgi:hypothetical protein